MNSLKIQWNHLAYIDTFCHSDEKLQLFGGNWIGLKKSKHLVVGSKYESNGKSKKYYVKLLFFN
jgi:hypothetical protein